MFWLTARDAEIYPWENDLHLQCDYFDLQAVELDSTSLALCFSHRWPIHSPNIYWVPTITRLRPRYLGKEKKENSKDEQALDSVLEFHQGDRHVNVQW